MEGLLSTELVLLLMLRHPHLRTELSKCLLVPHLSTTWIKLFFKHNSNGALKLLLLSLMRGKGQLKQITFRVEIPSSASVLHIIKNQETMILEKRNTVAEYMFYPSKAFDAVAASFSREHAWRKSI